MDSYQIIAGRFQATIEAIAMSVDSVAAPLEQAADLVLAAMLGDHKLIACGAGVDAPLAQLAEANLLGQFERERPALPALNLRCPTHTGDGLASALRALSQAGDVLLCICSDEGSRELEQVIEAAQERELALVLLSNTGAASLNASSGARVLIEVPAHTRAQVAELQAMCIHGLCDLIDRGLFGPPQPE